VRKILYAALIVLATAAAAAAYDIAPVATPEIDASALAGGVGLLAVGLFMFRARRKR